MAETGKQQARRMGAVARALVYLANGKFQQGITMWSTAAPEAAKVLGLPGYSGSAKAFIKKNLDALEEHVKKHRPQVAEIKRNRTRKRSIAEPKPWKKTQSVSGVDVASAEFLQTFEWRRLRMEALKKYGPKCMCCGATPADGAVMNVDHIKPRKLWPSLALSIDNLQILCHDCNHGKGNWDTTDWRK